MKFTFDPPFNRFPHSFEMRANPLPRYIYVKASEHRLIKDCISFMEGDFKEGRYELQVWFSRDWVLTVDEEMLLRALLRRISISLSMLRHEEEYRYSLFYYGMKWLYDGSRDDGEPQEWQIVQSSGSTLDGGFPIRVELRQSGGMISPGIVLDAGRYDKDTFVLDPIPPEEQIVF